MKLTDDVELLRLGHDLHAHVVDDHVLAFDIRVHLSHFLSRAQEHPVPLLHDVGLVDEGHLCKGKGFGVRVIIGVFIDTTTNLYFCFYGKWLYWLDFRAMRCRCDLSKD